MFGNDPYGTGDYEQEEEEYRQSHKLRHILKFDDDGDVKTVCGLVVDMTIAVDEPKYATCRNCIRYLIGKKEKIIHLRSTSKISVCGKLVNSLNSSRDVGAVTCDSCLSVSEQQERPSSNWMDE